MNPDLKHRTELMRNAVDREISGGPFIGCLPPGAKVPDEIPQVPDYVEFIAFTDGAICGEAVFYEVNSLINQQWMIADLDGGTGEWLVVGHLDLWHIVLRRRTGETQLLRLSREPGSVTLSYARFDDFLMALFSRDYLHLAHGFEDDWYRLLTRIGLA